MSKDNKFLFHTHKEPHLTVVRDTAGIPLWEKEHLTFKLKAINIEDN